MKKEREIFSLKMEAAGSSEIFVIFHHTAWSYILEDTNLHCVIYFHKE
jgi:hypothetical protein